MIDFREVGKEVEAELKASQKNVAKGLKDVKDGCLVVPLEARDPKELYRNSVLGQLDPKRLKA